MVKFDVKKVEHINDGICSKHFEERYLKVGKRTTLIFPFIYSEIERIYLHQFLNLNIVV